MLSERRTKTLANRLRLLVHFVDLQVQAGPNFIFNHKCCKYTEWIMHIDVILKEGQYICLQQCN